MLWNEELDERYPTVVDTDHPLSLGYRLKVITTSQFGDKDIRITDKALKALFKKGEGQGEGYHAVWDGKHLLVIVINTPSDEPWAKKRILELIVHEVSHAVDGFFERAHVKTVDTEVRAYYIDWIVGKVLCKFSKIAK